MRMFDVQGIEIRAPKERVFEFLREPGNLPRWAHAFEAADDRSARLETPAGAVDIGLRTSADAGTGIVDWWLEFPDGSAPSSVRSKRRGGRCTCIAPVIRVSRGLSSHAGWRRTSRAAVTRRGGSEDPPCRSRGRPPRHGTRGLLSRPARGMLTQLPRLGRDLIGRKQP
jgi:hypothetical protein